MFGAEPWEILVHMTTSPGAGCKTYGICKTIQGGLHQVTAIYETYVRAGQAYAHMCVRICIQCTIYLHLCTYASCLLSAKVALV